MFWNVLLVMILLFLAYKLGRAIGHNEAESHCHVSFLRGLIMTKRVMDQALILHGTSHTTLEEVSLVVNGTAVFTGSPREIAERSAQMNNLIEQLRKTYPELALLELSP